MSGVRARPGGGLMVGLALGLLAVITIVSVVGVAITPHDPAIRLGSP